LAIYHLSMKPICRASGRSAVAAAAYRSAEKLTNERDGLTHDFTRREGVEHAEIIVPEGSDAEWALDRSALWNAAERCEKRIDARVAREFEVALPHELDAEQRLELTREFAQDLADRYGAAVDFAIHAPHGASPDQVRGDARNFHAHLLMTTRQVTAEGLGDKTSIERENKWLSAHELPSSQVQLREIRQSWEQAANEHLARAGFEERIDHRSHEERGIEIEPGEHMGVHATQMERRGQPVSRSRLDSEASRRNAELIREKPEQVLSVITGEKSVFDHRDVARALHRAIDEPEAFSLAFAQVMASPSLVELQGERRDDLGRVIEPARYSTREMVEIERGMVLSASRLDEARDHGVSERHVEAALSARPFLSDEQQEAARHITGEERIAVVVGLAGAGKSTMLSAAREAWEREGFSVFGAALSGKAAEGLEESSGIASRTLASWENGWNSGRGELEKGDVLVIDEAGMVSSRQLASFVGAAERAGAKIVLVGDPEQLQPIQAGAAFRAVAERVGYASLEGVRRQGEEWQRAASQDFARHRTSDGLEAYADHGGVRFAETRDDVVSEIVRDVTADMRARPDGSRIVLAHRRVDVRELNAAIREARQDSGELARGAEAGEVSFLTNDGERKFSEGDRVIFLENNRDLGVKNGMLGTVQQAEEGRLVTRLDSAKGPGEGREVSVSMADYAAVDHGYATTIHKSQGATVDRAYVLASDRMDRHLSYVAMTRHREAATLYAGRDEFASLSELSARLSRSGAKETTLDYAERRGIAAEFGIASQIEVPRPAEREADDVRLHGDVRGQAPTEAGRSQAFGRDVEETARAAPSRELEPEKEPGVAEEPSDPLLELARSILAQDKGRAHGGGVRQGEAGQAFGMAASGERGVEPARTDDAAPADPNVQEAVAAAKDAYQTTRAVADAKAAFEAARAIGEARAAFEAERARQMQIEAERLRVAEEARQRAEAEALQEREAQQERAQSHRRSHGMER
jgi:Ti-type conjugative transfer relaxase TraA